MPFGAVRFSNPLVGVPPPVTQQRIVEAPDGSPPLYALAIRVAFPRGRDVQPWLLDRLAALRPDRGR